MRVESREIQLIAFNALGKAIKEKLPQYNDNDIWQVLNENDSEIICLYLDYVKWRYQSSEDELLACEDEDEKKWQERVHNISGAMLDLMYADELPEEFVLCMR